MQCMYDPGPFRSRMPCSIGKYLLIAKFASTMNDHKKQQAIDSYTAAIKPPRMKRSQLKATVWKLLDNNQVDEIMALIPNADYSDDDEDGLTKEQPQGRSPHDDE